MTMFSFGYRGCGRATPELVEAIDQAEAMRGHEPPLWVDIRIRRSARAQGFQGDIFGRLLGDRYRWMQELGNENVVDDAGGISIREPRAASTLLDLALANPERCVIFFCHCLIPADSTGMSYRSC